MMTSREKILAAIEANKPGQNGPHHSSVIPITYADAAGKFLETLSNIGGKVLAVNSLSEIVDYIKNGISKGQRVVTNISELSEGSELINTFSALPHSLNDVEFAIIRSSLGVAENGAVWIVDDNSFPRVLPFICQHLVVVLNKENIVATMHGAYEVIGNIDYGFATFIAGPSKTADIEQSLVLGAHGPRTMTVFILTKNLKT